MGRYLKIAYTNNINYILSCPSKGLSNLKINSIKTNNYLLNPYVDTYNMNKIRIKFNGSFLNRFPPSILQGEIVNIYIVYEINDYSNTSDYPTPKNCLFGSVKLTKNSVLTNMDILVMEFDLIEKHFFHILQEEQAKM